MVDLVFIAIVVALAVIVSAVIRVVPDRSRYAVFHEGNFVGLKGPGLLVKLPGRSYKWIRLSVNDKAEVIDSNQAAINGVNVPIELDESEASGPAMRVRGFRNNKVLIRSGKA